jgi:hypothetical protein
LLVVVVCACIQVCPRNALTLQIETCPLCERVLAVVVRPAAELGIVSVATIQSRIDEVKANIDSCKGAADKAVGQYLFTLSFSLSLFLHKYTC